MFRVLGIYNFEGTLKNVQVTPSKSLLRVQIKRASEESQYEKNQRKKEFWTIFDETDQSIVALSNRDNSISLTTPQASRDFKSLVFFVPT